MTYDDWKTTDPSDADYCSGGRYHCPPGPIGEGTRDEHCQCSCDHGSEDAEPSGNAGQLPTRYSCDSCGESRPVDCVSTLTTPSGEGSFCCVCRGRAPGECDAVGCENVVPARQPPAVGSDPTN